MAAPAFNVGELRDQLKTVDGQAWRVERTLRSTPYGATQVVWRADTGTGPFIRKVFVGDVGGESAYETLFHAQRQGRRFAHVPRIFDCDRTNDGIAVVMELLPGETLREYVASQGSGEQVLRLIAPGLCDALQELHTALEAPIIHRDIKPSNIMVNGGNVVLIDLDITRTWQEGAERDTARFGTPGYAPPEQFGFGQTSVASDIFAAGMTLAFCCTGEEPTAQLRESGFADKRIPGWVRPVLVRATQFDPTARFQSAADMKAALRNAMAVNDASLQAKQTESTLIRALKYLWNIFWITVFALVFIELGQETYAFFTDEWAEAMIVAQTHPGRVVFTIIMLFSLFAAAAVALYLMLFKVHRQKLGPFSKLTWHQELPVGAAFVAFVYLVVFYLSDYINQLL